MPDPLLLAYLAGIIDGEGCVAYHRRGANYKTKRFSITVNMTDHAVPKLLFDTFGGSLYQKHVDKEHYKVQMRWYINSKKAREAYALLRPYLRVKILPDF